MPKVTPIGSDIMKKSSIAKQRAEDEFKDAETIRNRIDALQRLTGCRTQEEFARMLNMPIRRLRYIRKNPEKFTMKEGICIQALARQYNVNVFVIDF